MLCTTWVICTDLNNFYVKRWICFNYTERFALLLNDLDGSMKISPGKYLPENCHRIFSPMKIPAMKIALQEKPSCENSFGNNCFAKNEKTDYL